MSTEKKNEQAKDAGKFSLEKSKGTELIAKNMNAFINEVVKEAGEEIVGGATTTDPFNEAYVQCVYKSEKENPS